MTATHNDTTAKAGSPPEDGPPAVEMVDLTIDGLDVSVPKNTLVIRAAERVGIEIPRFCDHPLLEPVGACRQCLVEIATPGPDGALRPMPKPQASCTITVTPGMQVKTQHTSPVADKAQTADDPPHQPPARLPVCDKGGSAPCRTGDEHGRAWPSRHQAHLPQAIHISSQLLLEPRALRALRGCTLLLDQSPVTLHRARRARCPPQSHLRGSVRVLLPATPCRSPVGALTVAAYRFRARPFDLVSTASACEHCASAARCAPHPARRRPAPPAANDPASRDELRQGPLGFQYAVTPARSSCPWCVRRRVASPPGARPRAAAAGLRAASGVGVRPCRLSAEDSYAYSNSPARCWHQRHRFRPPALSEEADFLASTA